MYFLVRLVVSLKMSDLHSPPPPLNSELTFSCRQLSIFWLFCICNYPYVDGLGARAWLCAVAGVAGWSASWSRLAMKGCRPKNRRQNLKDLPSQTHRLHQHAAPVPPTRCFGAYTCFPRGLLLCFYTFSAALEESSLEHKFQGAANICIFHCHLERINESRRRGFKCTVLFRHLDTRGS